MLEEQGLDVTEIRKGRQAQVDREHTVRTGFFVHQRQ